MSCDISDPSISEAYKQVLDGEVSWLLLGYMDTREKLFLYQKGLGGVDELKEQMSDPILYALMHYKGQLVYIVYVDENLSGVRRARTVVHGRTVASFFDQHDVHVYLNKLENLTQETIDQHIANKGSIPPVEVIEKEKTEEAPESLPKSISQIPELENPISEDPDESGQLFTSADVTASMNEVEALSQEDSLIVKIQSNLAPEVAIHKPEPQETKGLLEVEAKRKIQEAWKNRESVRVQFDHTQGTGHATQLSGYITIQGGGCCFWKRRWFVLRGETLYFYRDPLDRYPVSCLDLGGTKLDIQDSSLETLIPHCFKLVMIKDGNTDTYQMFSDSDKQKSLAVAGILECSKS